MLNILYEDEAVLVVWKAGGRGVPVRPAVLHADMVSEIRRYLSTGKPVDNHKLSTKSRVGNLMWELSTDWISR